MNILLIAPRGQPGEHVGFQYLFPLGLAYISSILKASGHTVTCLNLNHYQGNTQDILHARLKGDTTYHVACTGGLSTQYAQIKAIVEAIQSSGSKAKIVLGGGLISSEPELMFETLKPDYVVVGEGEETIRELAATLEQSGAPSSVPGIGYCLADGRFITTPARKPITNIDALPWPDFDGFEFETYLDNLKPTDQYFYDHVDFPRVYPIVTSRSCPFQCTFCYHPIGTQYRQRSLNSVMQELETNVLRHKINTLAIYDELFTNDIARVYDFCERITRLRSKLSWELRWGCQMRVNKIDDKLLATMRDAGCYMVSYGFESYSLKVLSSMKKHITPPEIARAVDLTLKNHISIQANFIFGDRAETLETARETLDYWKAHTHAGIQLGFINPYPGTQLYDYCLEKGVIKDKLDFIAHHIFDVFNMTESLTDREFVQLQFEVFACQLRNPATSVPSRVHLESNGTYTVTVTCPHCGHANHYANYAIAQPSFFNFMTYCRSCRHRFFMTSRLWRCFAKTILLFLAITPMRLKVAILATLRKMWRAFLNRRSAQPVEADK